MKYSLIKALCASTLFAFIFSINPIKAQSETASGLEVFCNDPEACNFNPIIIDLGAPGIGGGGGGGFFGCEYGDWYIPFGTGTGLPATQSCEPLEGYILADQCCIINIIANDSYCINNNWDTTCQNAYDACTGAAPDACNDQQHVILFLMRTVEITVHVLTSSGIFPKPQTLVVQNLTSLRF